MVHSSSLRSLVLVVAAALGTTAAAQVPVLRAVQASGGAASLVSDARPEAFVLTSPQGVKVFLDVSVLPADLAPALQDPRSVFLTTHADHLDDALLKNFKGTRLRGGQPVKEPGSVFWTGSSGDVKIQAVASSRVDDQADGGTNTILVLDVGGVRVVHMGNCGQSALSETQRKVIGKPDVLIQLLEDPLGSDADLLNQKAYRLVDQVAPTILVPTHLVSPRAIELLEGRYPPELAPTDELTLTPALLSGKKRAVFLGANRGLAVKAGLSASGDF